MQIFFDFFKKKYHYSHAGKYKSMDQISQSNLTEVDYPQHDNVGFHQHEHNHHHHHSIYPNSKHPLGPVTLRLPNKD